jgi:hypothetical protein
MAHRMVDIETVHAIGDLVQRILDGEVAGCWPLHLGLRQIRQVRFASFASEEDVLLAPKDDRLRLPLSQECLPFRVQLDQASRRYRCRCTPFVYDVVAIKDRPAT